MYTCGKLLHFSLYFNLSRPLKIYFNSISILLAPTKDSGFSQFQAMPILFLVKLSYCSQELGLPVRGLRIMQDSAICSVLGEVV